MAVTNVEANPGSGGGKFAVEDDGTQKFPYAALAIATTPVAAGAAAVPIQDGGNSITVDGTVGVTGVSTAANQASEITLLAGGLPAALAAGGGLKVEGVAGGVAVPVSLATVPSHAVTNAGTFATQVDGAALTALQLLDDSIFVDDAAFTLGTSKVNVGGGFAVAHGAAPDAAEAGDAVAVLTNRHRVPFMIGGHPNVRTAVYNTTGAQTDDGVLAAIASGTKYVVTRCTVTVGSACTVAVGVRLGFGATTLPALGASGADGVEGLLVDHEGLVPGAGIQLGDGSGILGVGGDGEELRITNTVPTGGRLSVSVSFYTIES